MVAIPHGGKRDAHLIQCKHTTRAGRSQGPGGVQEVIAAGGVYGQDYQLQFELTVITNSKKFTRQAKEVAGANGVQLIDRKICRFRSWRLIFGSMIL